MGERDSISVSYKIIYNLKKKEMKQLKEVMILIKHLERN